MNDSFNFPFNEICFHSDSIYNATIEIYHADKIKKNEIAGNDGSEMNLKQKVNISKMRKVQQKLNDCLNLRSSIFFFLLFPSSSYYLRFFCLALLKTINNDFLISFD